MFRTFLFVPGDRPERFDKAVRSGADAVCIDLEDAVSAANKEKARGEALAWLGDGAARAANVGLRINALDSIEGLKDAVALAESAARPAFVLLPKARSRDPVDRVRRVLSAEPPPIWALIETPESLTNLPPLAAGVGADGGLLFGGADLSAALGADMSWDALYFARASMVAAAATVGCQTIDVPFLDVRDIAGMVAETQRVKAMGFTGRACIHPDQVGPINALYTPTAEEVAKATAVIDAYEKNAGRVLLHEGRLVEKPVLATARLVIERAARARR